MYKQTTKKEDFLTRLSPQARKLYQGEGEPKTEAPEFGRDDKAAYDALPEGAPYRVKGDPHVYNKGQ